MAKAPTPPARLMTRGITPLAHRVDPTTTYYAFLAAKNLIDPSQSLNYSLALSEAAHEK